MLRMDFNLEIVQNNNENKLIKMNEDARLGYANIE